MNKIYMYLLCVLTLPSATLAEGIDLSQWRMSAGGSALFQFVVDKNKNTRFDAEFSPEFGVYLIDGLEAFVRLRLSGPLAVNATRGYEAQPITYGASLGAQYFFDTGSVFYPYIGVSLGADAHGSLTNRSWTVEVPAGVMIAINNNLGLTIGVAVRSETTFFDFASPSVVYLPFGIFGLKGFFN